MERLFIAIDIPQQVKCEIGGFCKKFHKFTNHNIRWVKENNLHITLVFLGETERDKREKISEILDIICKEISPFLINIEKKGFFPNLKEPRVVWLGVSDQQNNILRIYTEIIKNLESVVTLKNDKNFIPHLTIARISNNKYKNINKFITEFLLSEIKSSDFLVNGITLFRSLLKRDGVVYEVIKFFNFSGTKDT